MLRQFSGQRERAALCVSSLVFFVGIEDSLQKQICGTISGKLFVYSALQLLHRACPIEMVFSQTTPSDSSEDPIFSMPSCQSEVAQVFLYAYPTTTRSPNQSDRCRRGD